jgi:hypothetical protein
MLFANSISAQVRCWTYVDWCHRSGPLVGIQTFTVMWTLLHREWGLKLVCCLQLCFITSSSQS